MEIFPAIDLKDGACVRLQQGDFAAATLYDAAPLVAARRFEQAGANWLHVVDLDGARDGAARQTSLIARLIQETTLKVQAGGGVRTESDIETLLQAGAARVVIGSLAVTQPQLVRDWIARFGGDRIVLALDIRFNKEGEPEVLTRGWQDASGTTLWDVLRLYDGSSFRTLLCTDVGQDGMMTGPNLALYEAIQARFPALALLASGGIGSLEDIHALSSQGFAGAITGKALYENKLDLIEAIRIGKGGNDAR
ncbi:MAG: 1-(5-phosphoribosyl)-5-[(5-phosphoribosylamino)methylideneamino]imidazole-4-carboxamide isomerase [Alphaproteobacteria bacterium]|nr:1-(5-phosphoribosyl)-5-[(5-phosphoribosylamino)methylideneamino]imidazole-4-carboxamide isomerase [Alphaproteobacteria bacterium]